MPDFTLKPSFPIASVIEAAQRKAQIEQSSQTAANQQLVQGLGSIGQIGQSLMDQRMKVASALAVKNQFFPGMPDNVAKGVDPDTMLKMAGLTNKNVDMQMLFSLLHPNANGSPPANPATPVSQPAANAAPPSGGAMLTGGLGAPVPMNTPAPIPPGVEPSTATVQPLPAAPAPMPIPAAMPPVRPPVSVNPATAAMAFKMAQANRMEPVVTRTQAEAAGGVKHGTHILPDAKEGSDVSNPKYQDKLEAQYRNVLLKPLSNRSGGLGLEDSKVNQAIHLRTLVNKFYDPKSQTYAIPPSMHAELALGLARLQSPTGQVGIELVKELRQKTLREGLAGALIYLGADPKTVGGTTQDVSKLFIDSIDRQGQVSETNREQYMDYLRGLAPTELDQARKDKLEKGRLNSFTDLHQRSPDQTHQQAQELGTAYEDPEKEKRYQEYKASKGI